MAKKQKRMSKQELQAPDQVEVALRRITDSVEKYRWWVLGPLTLAMIVGFGVYALEDVIESSANVEGDALSAALDPFTAPLGEQPPVAPDDNSPQPETFEDQSAALKVASARLEAFKAEFGSSSAVAAADLALAGSQMRSGNSADAIAKLESWIAANANSPLKAGALMRLGEASLDVGNVDGARKAFEQLEAFATTDKLKAIALASLGDLDNPMVVKGGDAAAARKRYEAARALLGEEPTGATGIAAFLGSKAKQMRTELDDKLASLP